MLNYSQFFRYRINENNYESLENCTNIATITSVFKLFLREMLEPLITKEVSEFLTESHSDFSNTCDQNELIPQLKNALTLLKPLSHRVLHYILQHLKRVTDIKGNMQKLCMGNRLLSDI